MIFMFGYGSALQLAHVGDQRDFVFVADAGVPLAVSRFDVVVRQDCVFVVVKVRDQTVVDACGSRALGVTSRKELPNRHVRNSVPLGFVERHI